MGILFEGKRSSVDLYMAKLQARLTDHTLGLHCPEVLGIPYVCCLRVTSAQTRESVHGLSVSDLGSRFVVTMTASCVCHQPPKWEREERDSDDESASDWYSGNEAPEEAIGDERMLSRDGGAKKVIQQVSAVKNMVLKDYY